MIGGVNRSVKQILNDIVFFLNLVHQVRNAPRTNPNKRLQIQRRSLHKYPCKIKPSSLSLACPCRLHCSLSQILLYLSPTTCQRLIRLLYFKRWISSRLNASTFTLSASPGMYVVHICRVLFCYFTGSAAKSQYI